MTDLKLLIFSDSHHSIGNMYDAVLLERPDMVLHLGDCVPDAEDLSNACDGLDMIYVPGNCDYGSSAAPSILREIAGIRVFLTHGHLFGVKQGLLQLEAEAKRLGAQLVCFGHTHQPFLQQRDGIWFLNPGSCSAISGNYAIVTLENGSIQCSLQKAD